MVDTKGQYMKELVTLADNVNTKQVQRDILLNTKGHIRKV